MQWLQDTFEALTGEASQATAVSSPADQPTARLETSISRAQLLQFFKAGEELLQSETTRRKLKDARLLKQVLLVKLYQRETVRVDS